MRRTSMILFAVIGLLSFFSPPVPAAVQQDTSGILIPINLQLWHDRISQQQKEAMHLIGKPDQATAAEDSAVQQQVSAALIGQVNRMRREIETSKLDHRHQVLYLNCIYGMLSGFNAQQRYGKMQPSQAPLLVKNFSEM